MAAVPLFHLVILAFVQGLTEFLPISSSGHLVLVWQGVAAFAPDTAKTAAHERLILDVAVHVGTLAAVCLYFRSDLAAIIRSIPRRIAGHRDAATGLAFNIVVATLPVVFAGVAVKDRIGVLRDPTVIAVATIGFGLVLWAADRMTTARQRLKDMAWTDALLIGCLQILALIPGTSRAGITMTGARFLGYDRTDAARFSMLLSIPAILGAGTLAFADLYGSGNIRLGLDAVIAAGLAFAAAWGAIVLLMRWLRVASFTPFVIYRLILGTAILVAVYAL